MSNGLKIGIAAATMALVAFLAFEVFGIHTLFIDDEVSEPVPVFTSGSASGLESDMVDDGMTAEMNDDMEDDNTPVRVETDDETPEMPTEIVRLAEGTFVDRSHPGSGTAVVLTDAVGSQRFLRFEDFETDNGPDLNVYLVAGAPADGEAGLFDDDFIDLGDLKGNIGPQNYELAADVDLDVYNTVVVWCVRFSVAFTAADLS